jgi:phosphatidylglycerophosphate synthase
MISRWIRTWNAQYLAPLAAGLNRAGISPDALTLLGLAAVAASGLLLGLEHWGWAAALLLLGQVFDSLDGELARARGQATPYGAFLDSVCDHYGDLAVYLGLLWHSLQVSSTADIVLITLALFGSVFGSHVRARASLLGVDTRWAGLFTRFERSLVLIVGILANQITVALAVLALLNNFSALQRIVQTMRASRRGSEVSRS